MDTVTGDTVAVEFTSNHEGDSPVLPNLLEQILPVMGITSQAPPTPKTCRSDTAYSPLCMPIHRPTK